MTAELFFLAIAFVFMAILSYGMYKLHTQPKNQNYLTVDLATIQFDDEGAPKQDKDGKYIMELLQKDYQLKVPVIINSDDEVIKPPFFEHNKKLWVYHSSVQLNNRINLIVLFAGSVQPEKSPFCYDASKMEVVK